MEIGKVMEIVLVVSVYGVGWFLGTLIWRGIKCWIEDGK